MQFGLPVGKEVQENGLVTGDGEFNQLFSVSSGYSFYPLRVYVAGEAGLNNRTNGYSDEFRYLVEAGFTFANRITVIGRIRGLQSLENGEDSVTGGAGGLYANNQEYFLYVGEFLYGIRSHFGITFAVDNSINGRNAVAAPIYSLGFYWKK